jgi:hypothetical protein
VNGEKGLNARFRGQGKPVKEIGAELAAPPLPDLRPRLVRTVRLSRLLRNRCRRVARSPWPQGGRVYSISGNSISRI